MQKQLVENKSILVPNDSTINEKINETEQNDTQIKMLEILNNLQERMDVLESNSEKKYKDLAPLRELLREGEEFHPIEGLGFPMNENLAKRKFREEENKEEDILDKITEQPFTTEEEIDEEEPSEDIPEEVNENEETKEFNISGLSEEEQMVIELLRQGKIDIVPTDEQEEDEELEPPEKPVFSERNTMKQLFVEEPEIEEDVPPQQVYNEQQEINVDYEEIPEPQNPQLAKHYEPQRFHVQQQVRVTDKNEEYNDQNNDLGGPARLGPCHIYPTQKRNTFRIVHYGQQLTYQLGTQVENIFNDWASHQIKIENVLYNYEDFTTKFLPVDYEPDQAQFIGATEKMNESQRLPDAAFVGANARLNESFSNRNQSSNYILPNSNRRPKDYSQQPRLLNKRPQNGPYAIG